MKLPDTSLFTVVWRSALMVLALLVLQGCGGGGGGSSTTTTTTPTPDADPTGYYTNTGSLSKLGITDLQAMFYNGKVTLFSQAQGYGFAGTYTVSGNTVSGNLNEYKQIDKGTQSDTATFSATFNPADHGITGTLTTKTGVMNAGFTLNYASGRANSTVTAIVKTVAPTTWDGYFLGDTHDKLTVNIANKTTYAALSTVTKISDPGALYTGFDQCDFKATLTPVAGSLYDVSMALSGCTGLFNGTAYMGMAALSGSTLYIMASGPVTGATNGIFGVFN